MTVLIAASCSFLTPIGTPTNTLVWAPGGLQVPGLRKARVASDAPLLGHCLRGHPVRVSLLSCREKPHVLERVRSLGVREHHVKGCFGVRRAALICNCGRAFTPSLCGVWCVGLRFVE